MKKLALILILIPCALWAQTKTPGNIDIPFAKFVLDNGLTVIISEDHKAPIVAVNVWYHVGSKNEPKGRNGFAHLFEHLMFQGSENFNDDYFKATEKVGATEINGTTNEDRTNYFQNVPSTALDTILFLESDRMGHFANAITQARLDEQRRVVLNEKRQKENQPYYGIAEERIAKGTFPVGHPYSWTPIGSDEDLNAATLTDVKEWFKTYYGPNNATLTIVGDVKTQEALEKVKKYFGDIPAGPRTVKMKEWIAKRTESTREVVQDYVPLPKIFKVWNVPGITTDDLDTLDVVSDILTVGKNARLYKDIVYTKQLASEISATIDPREIASIFIIEATAKPGVTLEQLDAAINETMRKFIQEGPTADEIKRVTTQYVSAVVQKFEKIGGFGGKSDVLASQQVYSGNPGKFKHDIQHHMSVTPAMAKEAAKKWLSSGDYNLEIYPLPKFASSPSTVNRKTLPLPTSFPDVSFPKIQEATLSNGMKVLLAERHHIPTVDFSILFQTGISKDPKDKLGTSRLAFSMLDEGTKNHSLFEIQDKLAKLGSTLSTFSGMSYSGVSARSLTTNLDATMNLFAETVRTPAFLQEEVDRLKKELLDALEQEKSDPRALGQRILPGLLFGKNHPYGVPLSGSGYTNTVQAIQRKDIVDFYETWAKPNNATLIAVGDISLDKLTEQLEKHFRGWKKGDLPSFVVPAVQQEANRGKMFLVDRPSAIQTNIWAGEFHPSFNDPKEITNALASNIFGGDFTSRLNMNLREDKGWAYGAYARVTDLEGRRFWAVAAPVQTDKTDLAVLEIQKEIEGMNSQSKPITVAEFEKNKTDSLLQLAGVWETNASLRDPIKRLMMYGAPLDFYQKLPQKLKATTLAETVAASKDLFHLKNQTWLFVGDKARILPMLQKKGFTNITILDTDGNVIKN